MHNCYFYIILFTILIKLYSESILSYRIDQAIYLIDEQMITSCITKKSMLDYYKDGIKAIELDTNLLKEKINNTLDKNLPNKIDYEAKYYFYDSFTMEDYKKGINKCNSVQVQICFTYMDEKVYKYLRYQLESNYETTI